MYMTICVILIHDIPLSDVPDYMHYLKPLHTTQRCTWPFVSS